MLEGSIVNEKGDILGTHRGIHQYTIGQRRGLRIALGYRAYVSKIDTQKNAVILSEREESLLSQNILADKITWTGGYNPKFPLHCNVQIRYRSAPTKAEVTIENNQLRIVFESPCKAAAPGQAAVLYDENRVLGGGWISRTLD